MTKSQKLISQKFLLYKLLTNSWFVGAIWIYFYRIFITDAQIGILDGIAFAIGLVAEVPSGVLADKFGRDKMVRLGQILAGSGLIIQAFGTNLIPFVVGQAITMIGVAFVSGADQALFFDKLKFKKSSFEWRKLVTRGTQAALIGSMIANVAGGLFYAVDPRLPWILTGLSFILSVVIIWPLKETREARVKQKFLPELKEHLNDIKSGFAEFMTPKLRLYLPLILVVQGLFYAAGWGLLRLVLLDRFHLSPFAGSIAISVCSLITVGILALMHRHAERVSEKQVLTTIAALAGVSLLFAIPNIGVLGFFVVLTLYAGENVLYLFMSEAVNYKTSSEKRATVLSVASFMRTLPYVALAPIIGYLNTQHKLEYFFVTWIFLVAVAIVIYLSLKKKDSKLSLQGEETDENP